MTPQPKDFEDYMRDAVAWSGGRGREWEGDVLLSCSFYIALVDLLEEYVPPARLNQLREEYPE